MISPHVSDRAAASVSRIDALPGAVELTCRVVEGEAGFWGIESLWRDLLGRVPHPTPSLEWAWISAWWDVFGSTCPKTGASGCPYVIVVHCGTTPVAAYPFLSHAAPWWSLRLRRLRPMGYSGELEPSGLTEESLAIVIPGFEEESRFAVARYLSENVRLGNWDCAILRQRNPLDVPLGRWQKLASVASTKSKEGPQIVDLPDSWAAFRKQLSKSMRDNLPYYPRLLARSGHTYQVRIAREGEELAEAARCLIALHKLRVFSEVGHTHQDYFTHAWQGNMLLKAFERLSVEGKGFIATLEVDGAVVAAQAFVESGCELLVHYSGFDPSYAKFSPLLILQAEVFRRAIEEGRVRRLNLLYGNAPWQKRWNSHSEGREVRTLLIRLRPLSILRCALYVVARESVAYCRRSGLRRWMAAKLRAR